MKKYLILLLFNFSLLNAQSDNCDTIVNFGDIDICLPNIVGLNECLSDPLVKLTADLFKASEDEVILGLYLLNDTYESRYDDFFENGIGFPYIKVYSTELIKGLHADESALNQVSTGIKSMFDNYDKSSIKAKIESLGDNLDLSFGKPLLLEEYEISSKIKSFVVLLNIKSENENIVVSAIMNTLIIKNRLIFFAYYDEYKGMNNINNTKASNDYFALNLIGSN